MQLKILLVEDNPLDVEITETIFEKAGLQDLLVIARTGEEALAMAKARKPDLILLDFVLPGKNGLDVLTELRKNKETKKIPVLITSGYATDALESDLGEHLGVDGYIKKPIDPKELKTQVLRILGREL